MLELLLIAFLVLTAAAAGAAWQIRKRLADEKEARESWAQLAATPDQVEGRFQLSMVMQPPEPARRFFQFAIQPGTRLSTVVEISMEGELSLGTKQDPKYQPMRAKQWDCVRPAVRDLR